MSDNALSHYKLHDKVCSICGETFYWRSMVRSRDPAEPESRWFWEIDRDGARMLVDRQKLERRHKS